MYSLSLIISIRLEFKCLNSELWRSCAYTGTTVQHQQPETRDLARLFAYNGRIILDIRAQKRTIEPSERYTHSNIQ